MKLNDGSDLDFASIIEAESARNELATANEIIDQKIKSGVLDSGTRRGSQDWTKWESSAMHKKLANQAKIRQINLWVKHFHRSTAASKKTQEELEQEAKNSLFALIDHSRRQRMQIDELELDADD